MHGHVEVVAVAHELGAFARVEDRVDDGGAHARARPSARGARPCPRAPRRRSRAPCARDPTARGGGRPVDLLAAVACRRRSATRGSRRGAYARVRPGEVPMSTDLSDVTGRRAAGADPRVARRAPARRAGWRRSTPATRRSVGRVARRARLRGVVHRVRRGGLRHPHVAGGVRRRAVARARSGAARSTRCSTTTRCRGPCNIIGIGMGGPTVIAWGSEELKQQFLRGIAHQRGDLVPALQRAGRGLRRRGPGDARRARRRRVGRERPEGVDDARAPRPLRDAAGAHRPRPAEAQGPQLLRRRHAPARRRGAAAACRSPATPSSTRCSSTNARVPDAGGSGRRATAGGSPSPR